MGKFIWYLTQICKKESNAEGLWTACFFFKIYINTPTEGTLPDSAILQYITLLQLHISCGATPYN